MAGLPPSLQPICSSYLITSYIAALLFVVALVLFLKTIAQKQPPFTLSLVVVMMASAVMSLVNIGTMVKKTCILSTVPPSGLALWSIPVGIMNKAICGFCEHIFLINRFYHLSKNLYLSIFLLILTTAHVACHFTAAGWWFTHSLVPQQLVGKSVYVTAYMAGWSLQTAVDILVAIGTVWQLVRLDVVFTSTKSMIRKFLLVTVISGGLTAICGVVLLTLLLNTKYAFLVIAANIDKIYSITVFSNLALAHAMRQQSTVVLGSMSIRDMINKWSASTRRQFATRK